MTTPHPCTCGAQATFEQSLSDDGLLTTIVGCTECANKRIVRYPNFLHWAMKKELRTENVIGVDRYSDVEAIKSLLKKIDIHLLNMEVSAVS